MARKKVVLFIVEGITDKTSLGENIKELYKDKNVYFQIVRGDILADNSVTTSNVLEKVYDQITIAKRETYYNDSDIIKVVHLVDMDGVFINASNVKYIETAELMYTEEYIYTKNVDKIVNRNIKKSLLLNRLMRTKRINKIPYEIYYFSTNLEHVLHNIQNPTQRQKNELAEEFSDNYYNKTQEFLDFFKNDDILLATSYEESWEKIKENNNSLRRFTNFNVFLQNM